VVKNLAATASKFGKRIIYVSLRRCNMVILNVMKRKVNKSKSYKRSGKTEIRKKALYSTNHGKKYYKYNTEYTVQYGKNERLGK
jgi:hypothetical protein